MAEAHPEHRAPVSRNGWPAVVARLSLSSNLVVATLLFGILLLGGAMRFHGLDWDHTPGPDSVSTHQHPDERFLSIVAEEISWPGLAHYFDTDRSSLNPLNDEQVQHYVYGTLPLFAGKALASAMGDDNYQDTVMWGRRLTAAVDTATIAITFAIGALLFRRAIGLTAALLYALAVLPAQLAHFWTVDPYATFFGVATLLACVLWLRRGSPGWLLLAGITIGLALASKVTAWPVAMLPVAAVMMRICARDIPRLGLCWQGRGGDTTGIPRPVLPQAWLTSAGLLALCALTALLVFRIAQPYAWEGPGFFSLTLDPRWKEGMLRELQFQNGSVEFPAFYQFAGNGPWLTPLKNMVVWGLGPALGLSAIAGCIVAGIVLFRRRELTLLLPLLYVVAVFGFQAPRFVAFMRYFAPIYPVLCLLAVWMLFGLAASMPRLQQWIAGRAPRLTRHLSGRVGQRVAYGLLGLVVVATGLWALAFQTIYTRPHTRVEASEWIFENIPRGSALTWEIWDDRLPLPLPGENWQGYEAIETQPFNPDSVAKVQALIYGRLNADTGQWQDGIIGADYIVLASNRVRGTVDNLERRYPAMNRYYELLDSGELGFELVATFTSHPGLFGISIDDSGAEESFSVYDHPEVRIYQKTDDYRSTRALAMLLDTFPERAVPLLPAAGASNGLLQTSEQRATQQAGGTFTDVFDADGWASGAPWLWWLLWLEVAAFAALGWTTWLFGRLPDRGYGFSKVAGLIAVVMPVWMLVAWGAVDFSRGLTAGVFAGAVAAGLAISAVRWRSLREAARTSWRSWLVAEGVFLAAFTAFLLLRAWNPDAWNYPLGGEKPMEMAYLTAITRSTEMPPYDPWFAGGYLNYYYMGWFFMAVPMRLFQIVPEVGFNLGIPMYAGLMASTAYGIVANLVALSPRARALGRPNRWVIASGLVGVVFLMVLGNLDALHQLVQQLQLASRWNGGDIPVLSGAVRLLGGAIAVAEGDASIGPLDWWRSSRVHFGSFDITEFPFFSLLFGDVHPHVMNVPFFLLTVALGATYVVTVADGRDRLRPWVLAAGLGFTVGLGRAVHMWDFPTMVILAGGSITVGQLFARGRWDHRLWALAGHGAIAVACLTVPFTPFTRHFVTFNGGLEPTPETTDPQEYFAHFGLFVVVAALFLALRYREEVRRSPGNIIVTLFASPLAIVCSLVFMAGVVAISLPFDLVVVGVSTVVLVLLLKLVWIEWRASERDIPRMLATLLFALAFAIAAGVDVVRLKDDLERMNTVFKFSLQSWHLFALAGAWSTWYLVDRLRRPAFSRWQPEHRRRTRLVAMGMLGTVLLFVMATSLYAAPAIRARQATRYDRNIGPTLDGMAYLRQATPVFLDTRTTETPADDIPIVLSEDLPLIDWLRANVEGSPVVMESPGALYSWASRISVYTGLPTVIGWDWHETQQRMGYRDQIQQRYMEARMFYTTADAGWATQFLRRYGVSYVVVGAQEWAYGSREGIAKFDGMRALTEVFRDGRLVIYRVDPTMLAYPIPLTNPEPWIPMGPLAPIPEPPGSPLATEQ